MQKVVALFIIFFTISAVSEVHTRIIDTGPGHASVTRFPNGDIMVFDTGHYNHDPAIFDEFASFIGDADIDLLVVSHSDADHLGATDELFGQYRIHRVIRTGFERDTAAWADHDGAINNAEQAGLTHDINLSEVTLPHGTTYQFGEATVMFLSGFHRPPAAWGLTGSEFRNGNSIVVRVAYQGHSVLFTGDAVGRHEGTAPDARAIATERFLIDNAFHRPIDSDVLIVPHHGSDDASSLEFIRAVSPTWIVFPAGSQYQHPRAVTAGRFIAAGLQPECMLRTDLGEAAGPDEWDFGSVVGQTDSIRDDNVDIIPDTSISTKCSSPVGQNAAFWWM